MKALGQAGPTLRVLDPMAGSGTVLAVARAQGHRAFGVDLDPLAVLLSDVWTRSIEPEDIRGSARIVLRRAERELVETGSARAYPRRSDRETRDFIRYWFDAHSRRQLTALSLVISRIREETTRKVLWCGFSRLIITKQAGASLAMDLSHSRPHKKFDRAPIEPFSRFVAAVDAVVANCPQVGRGQVGPPAVVREGDARNLPIRDRSIDLVLTSPPYLNAIDYLRCSKFALVWMGYTVADLRKIRGMCIGSEVSLSAGREPDWMPALLDELRLRPPLSDRNRAIMARYITDMDRAVAEVARVLRPGGRAVYVVGDSTVRGTFVRNSTAVASLARRHGLSLISRQSRSLPPNRRYLPPPTSDKASPTLSARMRREVVMVFSQPGEQTATRRVMQKPLKRHSHSA